eukprot:3321829-Rhodomonas_salina.1
MPRKLVWGCHCSRRVWPARRFLRLLVNGGPPRTANTPALGRGWLTKAAMSPVWGRSGEGG